MTDETGPPPDFHDEGDAELQDPDLQLETTSSSLRVLWAKWMCRAGGSYTDVDFFGRKIGGVPTPAVDAYRAMEEALTSMGYLPKSRWAYNCRKIADSSSYSLHSAGIAIDIDPNENPYSAGDRHSGTIKANHVAAVLAVRNSAGRSVWSWGGNWSTPDRMHFQLDQGPDAVDVNWSTVPGHGATASGGGTTPAREADSSYVVKSGDTLRTIAETHGSTIGAFIAANPNMDPDRISPGQKLAVPGGTSDGKSKSTESKGGKPRKPKTSAPTYVVQSGDTLKQVAADHGVSLTELLAANPQLPDPDVVRPGVSLNLPE